jgi:hypothetical protein
MPKEMPVALDTEYGALKRKNDKATRPLEWTLAIDFCARHVDLTETIPLGRHAGWPETVDPETLAMRVLQLSDDSRSLIQWRGTKFFLKALKSFEKEGGRDWDSQIEREARWSSKRLIAG